MTTRNIIEWQGRQTAGVIEEVGDYQWVRILNMFEMYVHKDDQSLTPCLVRDGFWESWITKWVIDNVGPGTVFYDIGAHSGYYAMLAYCLGALASAYEPNPTYYNMIKATLERHGIKHGLRVSQVAFSNYNGEATLHVPGDLTGSASLSDVPNYQTEKIEVKVARFDDFHYSGPGTGRRVFKIDAESEEERILEGMRGYLSMCINPVIMLEYTPGVYTDRFLLQTFAKYNVSRINHDGQEEAVSREWVESQTDWAMLVLRRK